ncbi:helix-turn-helix transcriptional regulator [Kibdelosporangium lantanae]|uniref:Helix-turn-helix transcriptional regulator n=1 Tax=Kibdelosporangium lantanae TaxID=1497396 RepID=A0ABW3M8L9_9PSEU
MMKIERLWGIEELSTFLDIPVNTIRAWRKTNYGPPARKVGKHLRWDPETVREWFANLGQSDAA